MNNQYIWQSTDLYQLTWQDSVASTLLSEVSLLRGKLLGRLSMFGFKEQGNSMLDALTEEIVHSSEIEGERLNRDSVRSSVAQQLGLEYDGLPKADHYIEGDARCNSAFPRAAYERATVWLAHCPVSSRT